MVYTNIFQHFKGYYVTHMFFWIIYVIKLVNEKNEWGFRPHLSTLMTSQGSDTVTSIFKYKSSNTITILPMLKMA